MSAYPKLTDGENGSASDVEIDVSRTHNPDAWQQLFDRGMDEWDGTVDPDPYKYTCEGHQPAPTCTTRRSSYPP